MYQCYLSDYSSWATTNRVAGNTFPASTVSVREFNHFHRDFYTAISKARQNTALVNSLVFSTSLSGEHLSVCRVPAGLSIYRGDQVLHTDNL
jgi:hypothetical protein